MGNIEEGTLGVDYIPVHPHRRGEHGILVCCCEGESGSSPQAWGTSKIVIEAFRTGRFIPTGVGNIAQMTSPAIQDTVHPHRRGEHPGRKLLSKSTIGSSPQAWGTYRR